MKRSLGIALMSCALGCLSLAGCAWESEKPDTSSNPADDTQKTETPVYGYQVVGEYPHDRTAFTQGLIFREEFLYEGTGLYGQSSVRKVSLEKGEVVQEEKLPNNFFGEGVTQFGDKLIQLTWKSNTAFVYDRESLQVQGQFNYSGEGWGLTTDGRNLIMSDGTSSLRFLDPNTYAETSRLSVHDSAGPVSRLNELEYVRGEVYANVWRSDRIARISPQTGEVVGWIDLAGLLSPADNGGTADVLNGIAYDEAGDRLFVTGKWWPILFEIELIPPN